MGGVSDVKEVNAADIGRAAANTGNIGGREICLAGAETTVGRSQPQVEGVVVGAGIDG